MLDGNTRTHTCYEECEDAALRAINTGDQDLFCQIILQSPSPYSFRLGVLYTAQLSWCDALTNFLLMIQTSPCPPNDDKSDILSKHSLYNIYFERSTFDFCSAMYSKSRYEELALMEAIVKGSTQVVRVLAEFIDPNFDDMFGKPFMDFVYLNKDKTSRRKCLETILPKLELSDRNLTIVAENGDLLSVEYLVDRMKKGARRFLYVRAVEMAIENGHDEIAKWMISQPNLIPWEHYAASIVFSATKMENYDMLVFLSQRVPELVNCTLGFMTADALWKFLREKDRVLYGNIVHEYPEGEGLSPF